VSAGWLLLPRAAADRIAAGGRFGDLSVAEGDEFGAVASIVIENGSMLPAGLTSGHLLHRAASHKQGYWRRADPELHILWQQFGARGLPVPSGLVTDLLEVPLVNPGGGAYYLLTYAPHAAVTDDNDMGGEGDGAVLRQPPEFVAWLAVPGGLVQIHVDVEVADTSAGSLEPQWPAGDLAAAHVVIVGLGSIGSAAARELAQYGVGTLSLVDPDRLSSRNLVRHTLDARDVGRLKVDAVAEQLGKRWPQLDVGTYPLNVVTDTHLFRPLVDDATVVLCAADGVTPRRVVSHESRRNGTDAVLACVLMDGELGEVIRLRPRDDEGCLLCRRVAQIDSGAVDMEAGIDLGYGTGEIHRPMTAVGSDLHLVAALAAKVTVATLLQARGHRIQRLAGEQAVLRLRGGLPHKPPFDVQHTGELAWTAAAPPRTACATCTPA
jgi:hypothetical protein